jgi:hypothetical protein
MIYIIMKTNINKKLNDIYYNEDQHQQEVFLWININKKLINKIYDSKEMIQLV